MEKILSLQEMSLLALTKQFGTLDEVIAFCESSELVHNVSSVADNFWKETLRRFRKEHLVLMRGDLDVTTMGRGVWYHFVKSLETGLAYKYHVTDEYRGKTRIIKPRSLSTIYQQEKFDIDGLLPKPNTRGYYCEGISYKHVNGDQDDIFNNYFFYNDQTQGYLNLLRWIAGHFHRSIQLDHRNLDGMQIQVAINHNDRYVLPANTFNKESLIVGIENVCKHLTSDTNLSIVLDLETSYQYLRHEYFNVVAFVM